MVLLDSCSFDRCFTFYFPGPSPHLFAFLQYNTQRSLPAIVLLVILLLRQEIQRLNLQQGTNEASFMFCAALVSLLS